MKSIRRFYFDEHPRCEVTHRNFTSFPNWTYESGSGGEMYKNVLSFTYYNNNAKFIRYDKDESSVEFNVNAYYMQYDQSGSEIGPKFVNISGRFTEFIDN